MGLSPNRTSRGGGGGGWHEGPWPGPPGPFRRGGGGGQFAYHGGPFRIYICHNV